MYASIEAPAVTGVDYRWKKEGDGSSEVVWKRVEQARLDEDMLAQLLADLDGAVAADVEHFEAALQRAVVEREDEERLARDRERDRRERERFSSVWGRR